MRKKSGFFLLLIVFSYLLFGITSYQFDGLEPANPSEINLLLKNNSIKNFVRLRDEKRANAYTTNDQGSSSICALSSDSIALAWQSDGQDGDGRGIYARVFNVTTGNNITAEFRVNENATYSQYNPSICALSKDTLAIAWRDTPQDPPGDNVLASVFNATTGNKLIPDFRVNAYTASDQYAASICALSSDAFAVAWMSSGQDGSGYGVYARVFNATTGNNITAEIRANQYTTNEQMNPSICGLPNDSVAVAWQSYGQDSSGFGIYFSVFGPDISAPTVSIVSPTTGTYGLPSLLINASISDLESHVTGAKVMINTTNPFNITMTNPLGNYWITTWNNMSLYSSGYYKMTIWAIDNAGNVNQTQFVIIYLTTTDPDNLNPSIPGYDSIIILFSIMGITLIAIRKYKLKAIKI